MSAPKTQGSTAQNDDDSLPGNWYETDTSEIARFKHPSGALLRIRREIPMTSAEKWNRGERIDANGELVVLYHETSPLPSTPDEVHRGGTEQDAREAAHRAMCERAGDDA